MSNIHWYNWILWAVFGLIFLWIFSFLVNFLSPYSYNVNQTYREYGDICVGDNIIPTKSARTIRPTTGFTGRVTQEIFRLENGVWMDTDISRDTEVVIENNDGVIFEKGWIYSDPVDKPGVYGIGILYQINPFPLVHKTYYSPPEDNIFGVLECN